MRWSAEPVEAAALSRAAAATDADLLAMMRDPVLRNAFETDRQTAAKPEPGHALMLRRFLELVDVGSGHAPSRTTGQPAPPAWPAFGRTWVLTGPRPRQGDMIAERLADLLRQEFSDLTSDTPIAPAGADHGGRLLRARRARHQARFARHAAPSRDWRS